MADVPGRKKKVESERDVEFAEGGDTPMFGTGDRTKTAPSDAAGPQKSGQTDQGGGGGGGKYAEGGKTKMFGYSPSVPAKEGITGAR